MTCLPSSRFRFTGKSTISADVSAGFFLECGERGAWDSDRIGAGAPPIRVPEGWLQIYHGVRKRGLVTYEEAIRQQEIRRVNGVE